MPPYTQLTFRFGRELGRRLRLRQGLSLRALALLMDRQSAGAHNQLARLEQGRLNRPSLNLVADYLRACRARFGDLEDLLDSYTGQEPVPRARGDAAVAGVLSNLPEPEQRAMLAWERAMTQAREKSAPAGVETDQQRVFRTVWSFIRANWNEVREQKLFEALVRLGPGVEPSDRKRVCGFGRKMFGVMTRAYATETRRRRALDLVRRRAAAAGLGSEVIAELVRAANEARAELEQTGRLDWEPTEEQIVRAAGRAPLVEKAETTFETLRAGPIRAYNKALALVDSMVRRAIDRQVEERRLDFPTQQHYRRWADWLLPIALAHGTDSVEWRAEVDRAAPRLHDEQFARAVARAAAEAFNAGKAALPPRPDGLA